MSGEMQPDTVLRTEYEQFVKMSELRISELRLEYKEGQAELKSQFTTLSTKMDTLSAQMASKGLDAWKLVATSSVSLIGGYLLFYLQHLFAH